MQNACTQKSIDGKRTPVPNLSRTAALRIAQSAGEGKDEGKDEGQREGAF
jgi:hypothetical protein